MIPQIQGLRALAALLVILFHAHFLPGGFIGVDIFYVISGYLITGLLLREMEKSGSLSFAKFYTRRLKRLLPSSFAVLISTTIASYFILPSVTRAEIGRDVIACALYVSNYLFAHWQNDYQNLGAAPSPVIHFWSLAVEEQFYLLWPILLALSYKWGGRRLFFRAVFTLTATSFLYSIYLTSRSPIWSFYSLPTRAWELGLGALILWRPVRHAQATWRSKTLGALGALAILIASALYSANTAFPGWAAVLPVLGCVALVSQSTRLPRPLSLLLDNRIGHWVGGISYPAYLWHWPVLILVPEALGHPLTVFERIAGIALTLALAEGTHRYIEEPLRRNSASPRSTLIFGLALTLISVSSGAALASATPKEVSGVSLITVKEKPAIYADGCQLDKTQTESGPCIYGDRQSSETVVLFGDSHAAQWFPTLQKMALAQRWKLIVLTKSSCPAVAVLLPNIGAFQNAPCQKWRANSFARIRKTAPFLIFTSSFEHYVPPATIKDRAAWWSAGYAATVRQLVASVQSPKQVIVIQDTPLPIADIPSCLASQQSTHCYATKSVPRFHSHDASQPITTIDPDPWVCNGNVCPAIVHNTVVYRDNTHLSVAFAASLTPVFTQELVQLGLASR